MSASTITRREGRFSSDRLASRVWEAVDPKAIVVIAHGYAEHSGRYDHVGTALAEAGFSTWALDHFGHGRSQGDDRGNVGDIENAIADMDEFVSLASASNPGLAVFLIGHSMGGMLAVAYTEEHQDRLAGLVVTGAAVVISDMIMALLDLDVFPAVALVPFVVRDPEVVKAYDDDPLNYHGAMPRDMLAQAPERIGKVRNDFGKIS